MDNPIDNSSDRPKKKSIDNPINSRDGLVGAVIGAGYFSQFHYEAWSRIDAVSLVACCDLELEKAQRLADEHQIGRTYSTVEAMLRDLSDAAIELDFIDVVTGPATHRAIIETILSCRLDHPNLTIICQKPLAPDYDGAVKLVATCAAADVPFVVHENFRFQPWYREIKKLLNSGVIGSTLHTITLRHRAGDGWGKDAYLNRQAYFRTMPRMLVFETGIHAVDCFRYLMGDITQTFAHLRRLNPVIAGEDTAVGMFQFSNGGIGIYDANRFNECNGEDSRYTFGELLIEFDGGTIRSYLDGKLTIQRLGEAEIEHHYQRSRDGFAGDCVFAAQQHFAEVMLSGTGRFETEASAYLSSLAVQEAMYRSSESGQWEPVISDA